MTKSVMTALALALGLTTGAVWAQESGSDAATTTDEAAQAPSDLGQPRPDKDSASVGEIYEVVNGDWISACEKTLSGDDPCRMGQLLRDDNQNPVMEAELTRLKGENLPAALLVIKTPILTLLPEGVSLSIDGSNAAKIPFLFCDQSTCVARVNLRNEDVAAFTRGNKAAVKIVPMAAPDKSVTVDMSLSGFTAAYDGLTPIGR